MKRNRKDEQSGGAAYRQRSYRCATCGRPTASRRNEGKEHSAGHGDFHYTCRRQEGRLVVWDDILKGERPL